MFTHYTICSVGGSTKDAKRAQSFYFTFNYSIKGRRNAVASEETGITAVITATCTVFFHVIAPLPAHLRSGICACVSSSQNPRYHMNAQGFSRMQEHPQVSQFLHCTEIASRLQCSQVLNSGFHLWAVPHLLASVWISFKFPDLLLKPAHGGILATPFMSHAACIPTS